MQELETEIAKHINMSTEVKDNNKLKDDFLKSDLDDLVKNNDFFNKTDLKKLVSKLNKKDYSEMDETIELNLAKDYHELLKKVVDSSFSTLDNQVKEAKINRRIFAIFFLAFLFIQFAAIMVLVILKGLSIIELTDTLLQIIIVSFFVETLGVVTGMVMFVFNSKTELGIINSVQRVVDHYQK